MREKMPSEAYQLFLDSMIIGFDQWHDGTGYDLEALGRLGPVERASIEKLLIKNLEEAGDWRDVQALAALGTTSARAAVDEARFHRNTKVRNYALRIVIDTLNPEDSTEEDVTELEEQVIQAVKHGDFELAERMPTMRVKRALLECAREADSDTRVSAAALLLYLCGQAPEPFDWSQRPFFLLFGEEDPKMLYWAWQHLRKRTGL
jgi:hypothetical protein